MAGGGLGLHVIDISTLSSPAIIGSVDTPGYARDVYVSGSYAYVADGLDLQVIDISIPSRPAIIGSIDTPDYTHSVHVLGSYAYVADDSGIKVIDISTPSSLAIIGSVDTIGYAYDVYVSGSYAYVAEGWGWTGLQIIDISTPSSPTIIASLDTPGYAYSVYVSGSYAYVEEGWGWTGLQIIDISPPSSPVIIGLVGTPLSAHGVVHVSGNYAYVTGYYTGFLNVAISSLQVIDISIPSTPQIRGSVDIPGVAEDVYVSGNYAYLANWGSVHAIDISTPSDLTIIGSVDTPGIGDGVNVSGSYAYVADGAAGLQVIMTSIISPLLLDSNVVDSTTTTAAIPADLPQGAYNINVTNPGGEVGTLHNGFRVVEELDLTPPVITEVEIIDIKDTSAVVTWHTDEPSDSVVEFGTASGNYTDSVSDPTLVTSHNIELTDLTAKTIYYLVVKSADSSNNSAQSEEYSFTTKKGPGCFINTAAEDNSYK